MNLNKSSMVKTLFVTTSLTASISVANASQFSFPQGVYNGEEVVVTEFANGGILNAAMLEKIETTQPEAAYVKEVTDGVWAIVGYHYGYKAVIEGEKGLILFDTGDDIEEAQEILDLIQLHISEKPIHTVIYSHSHYGFGTQAITAKFGEEIKIIGHPELNRNVRESNGLGASIPELSPSLYARTLQQFSAFLPDEGPDGKAPSPIGKTKGLVPVNTPVANGQSMTIDGIELQFFTEYDSDSDDQVIVYLPETKTVLNNHLWPTFPNFYTLRGSVYRDPTAWAEGIKMIRDLEPEYLINTHAAHLSGKDEIQTVLNGYYDAIMYLYDQTLRGILHGKTPDELRYWVQLPNELAEMPHNQMSYGEFSYYPPYIYNYALGWFGRDVENLNRIAPNDQARKIIEGFGGVEAVKQELKETLSNKEFAWSAELGGYLVKTAPNDVEARLLLADAMRQMGYRAEASIPRSWYLTRALELEGKIEVPAVALLGLDSVMSSPADTFVQQFRVRLNPSASLGQDKLLAITIEGEDASTMGLHLRSSIAEYIPNVEDYSRSQDMSISMPKQIWGQYFMGEISLSEMLNDASVTTNNKDDVKTFFEFFDQVAPSKDRFISVLE
ncbi:alkyl sulfatase dimerization domain-containing protein [Vibrio sp. 10N.261.46.E12]|nr:MULTISPECIES: alkyl sulfatase dimerization domain-containing protein [unclassified Vibrio]OMO35059.1 alkyl sulfatase [Vibrio sp. 10N.261.45.E1]PMJ36248.1 alkyl sulfatase [Vibrio sp. 10N.286.45.B6]PML96137.1 alkyl sulfatase [Vibrio sp. 10N.261.49.E11]PMM68424.1 alkyl sulfatase [Vibrio sp. 10N.261.46.F12]PMM80276.1 alkyl sulfatase [Vibrio sp. 10N.261.46.E8]